MRKIFNIGGYLQRNTILNMVWLFTIMAVHSYAPLVNAVLIEYYNMTEDGLSLLSGIFIIGFLFAYYLNNFFMNNHYNIIKILMFSNIALLLSLLCEMILFWGNNFNFEIFMVLRVMDGFLGFLISTTIGHIISSKILRSEYRIKITSLMSTVGYVVKAGIPILVSLLIVTTSTPAVLFMVAIIMTILTSCVVYLNKKALYFKYTRVMLNNTGSKKRNTLNELNKFCDNNVKGLGERVYYLVVNGFHNSVRSAYDLVIPASLLINYNFDLAEVAMLVSLMVVGQSMQFKVQFLLKIMGIELLYFIHLIVNFVVLVVAFWWGGLSYFAVGFLFFMLGVSRSIYAIWVANCGMEIVSKDITIQNLHFINGLVCEGAHLLGYGIVILLIVDSGDYTLISIFYGSIFLVLGVMQIWWKGISGFWLRMK